jgi:glycosyltransferase involved in cell wall biosynthesis
MMKKKLLIVVPDLLKLGGVANHYLGLKNYWTYDVKYEYYGKRKYLPALFWFPVDILKFILKLIFTKTGMVVINPSFRRYQLFRDGIYLILAKLFNKNVITFIHGWDDRLARTIIKSPGLFQKVYNKSSLICVLCSQFKEQLLQMGMTCPVVLTTTKVNDALLENFRISSRTGRIKQILFLARVERTKGIFITLDAFKLLLKEFPALKLIVCGDGSSLNEAKRIVKENRIPNVLFTGNISGKELIQNFEKSDLYLLPTSGEGMATSVLEAMAFGLPVITRPVGGINDFFINGEMGFLVRSFDPKEYAKQIRTLLLNPERTKKISYTNHQYAVSRFLASNVTRKFEQDIREIIP